MMTISSPAGRRLAKARAAVKASQNRDMSLSDRYELHTEFEEAAQALSDELMASGFHLMDGDD